MLSRRQLLFSAAAIAAVVSRPVRAAGAVNAAANVLNDPLNSSQWPQLRKQYLGDAAMHLPQNQLRRDQRAKIINHRIAIQPQRAGFGVNLHLGQMRAIGK